MKPHILLAEDDYEMRYALKETLIRCGYYVDTAAGGNEALDKFNRGRFNLVISDVKMRDSDGIYVLKEIKRRSPDIPVVLITAYGTINSAVEAMKLGAFDYIIKPFSIETLEKVVRKGIDSISPQEFHHDLMEGRIITKNRKMLRLLELAEEISRTDVTVLIEGESGTGKEMMARFIHNQSLRSQGPFIAINCAAIPEGLLESELFGYEKGAFTGAVNKRSGKFLQAHTGTLLLDEISEMILPLQAKLLRVIQERQVDPIGGKEPVNVDIRFIATTNKSLKKEVEECRFREDLYFRLNVFPITLPPLRERKDDIPLLSEYFLKKYRQIGIKKHGTPVTSISEEALDILMEHEWRGNIRELENTIERAIIMCDEDMIKPEHLIIDRIKNQKEQDTSAITPGLSVREMEQTLIIKTLEEVGGNRTKAAKLLGIGVRTLRNKLKEYREEGLI